MEEKINFIKGTGSHFQPGEAVNIVMKESHGMLAVFLAYILPVIIIIGLLVPSVILEWSDLIIALILLGSIAVYYIILYQVRHRLQKKFTFEVYKSET